MATLIVEDGTGKPDANTTVTDVEFTTWMKARGVADMKMSGDRSVALIKAADYLRNERRLIYSGTKNTSAQTMPYPRTGVTERRGQAVPSNIVPYRFKEAQMELGRLALGGLDLQPRQPRGGQVQTKTIGPLSTTWFQGAPADDLYPFVLGILAPLLVLTGPDGALDAVPFQTGPEAVVGYNNEYHPFGPGEDIMISDVGP